ncbi:hypothetical protein BDM02DRAFT_3120492 [Thelephora ganbajun]|uniref:Uncharacterized protein n=1 Tax=Thelephora ganbajun TaxID=370292 RepID=A0ACB6Z6G2_THEGA|nr:hypothetical protein BDM02DRAFT_3120492 [Thelephora ganbajun]
MLAIQHLNGSEEPQRQARRECFNELRNLVGPWTGRLCELKVLDNGMYLASFWEV